MAPSDTIAADMIERGLVGELDGDDTCEDDPAAPIPF
jgi:hypothetical protein